jgi:predicted DNA-binding transcriptional regulator YafY
MQAMVQTSARLLRLLSLFQAQRYWSGADLSERLEVTARTLRRDVDRLRSLGYPVHSTSGIAGGYQLGAGATLPPLLLDDDEAVAVALGLRTSASGGVSGIEEASVRALMKLEQVLPPRLRHRVAALHGFIVPLKSRGPNVDAAYLSLIAGACRDNEGIRFSYKDRSGASSARTVEPIGAPFAWTGLTARLRRQRGSVRASLPMAILRRSFPSLYRMRHIPSAPASLYMRRSRS